MPWYQVTCGGASVDCRQVRGRDAAQIAKGSPKAVVSSAPPAGPFVIAGAVRPRSPLQAARRTSSWLLMSTTPRVSHASSPAARYVRVDDTWPPRTTTDCFKSTLMSWSLVKGLSRKRSWITPCPAARSRREGQRRRRLHPALFGKLDAATFGDVQGVRELGLVVFRGSPRTVEARRLGVDSPRSKAVNASPIAVASKARLRWRPTFAWLMTPAAWRTLKASVVAWWSARWELPAVR
jgi:hypothetical protein